MRLLQPCVITLFLLGHCMFASAKGCDSSLFGFRSRNHLDYIQLNGTLPEMTSFTTCAWVRPADSGETVEGSLMSYCTDGARHCNTLLLYIYPDSFVVYMIGATEEFKDVPPVTARSHLCLTLSTETGQLRYYINATETAQAVISADVIPQGGVLILGQDQDGSINGTTVGFPNQPSDGFYGDIEGLLLWNRNLTSDEITEMYNSGCNCVTNDAIVNFDGSNSIVEGQVVANFNNSCFPVSTNEDVREVEHQFHQGTKPDQIMSMELLNKIVKTMKMRIPELKQCFTLLGDKFTGESGIEFGDVTKILAKFIHDIGCDGDITTTMQEFDPNNIIRDLRKLDYKECNKTHKCFNEYTVGKEESSTIDIFYYIYQGQCLLPEKDYFDSAYLANFKDSTGKASRIGFGDFQKKLGIKDIQPDEDHNDDDSCDDCDNKKKEDKHDQDHGHDSDDAENKSKSDETKDDDKDNIKTDGDSQSDYSDKSEPEIQNVSDQGGSNSQDKEGEDGSQGGGQKFPKYRDEKEELEGVTSHDNEPEKTTLDDTNVDKTSNVGSLANDDISDNQPVGAGNTPSIGTDTITNPDDNQPNDAENGKSNVPSIEHVANETLPDSDDNEPNNHAHVRRKRSSHSYKESKCYTSDQLMDIFEVDEMISDEKAMEICPALIHQIQSEACKSKNDYDHSTKVASGYTQAMAYGYGTVSVAIISLLALLGLALFPVLESTTYKIIMQFFIGLAVGTLSSDALIHIIPQILGVHDHGAHDSPDHDHYEEDKLFIWQMSVVFGGLYIVAGFESFLRAIKKSRKLAKRKRQESSYQETPGIDNLPDGSSADNAVTSFSGDVVSNDSLSNKEQKLSITESEQMLPRHDIICCNFTPTLITVFIGDILHNFADGLAIGVAFASHWSTGISTSIAILCHELPHEIGDFAIYLRNGASKWKAIGLNFTAACCNFIGLYSGINMATNEIVRRWLLCVVAGIFLYISLVQVMSTMLKDECDRPILKFFIQNIGMLLGWSIMLLIALYEDQIRIGT